MRFNIVGFATDDPVLEQTLASWTELDGGEYFAADLGPALTQALHPTFEVRDSDGPSIGSGILNGGAAPVSSRRYTVFVHTGPPITIDRVIVEPGETTDIVLEED